MTKRSDKRGGGSARSEDRFGDAIIYAAFSPASDADIARMFGLCRETVARMRRRLFRNPPACVTPLLPFIGAYLT